MGVQTGQKLHSPRFDLGFTLIEIMVTVAIIGILAGIAIPNYNRYMARSRSAEAKTNLAGAYTSLKRFYVEYSSYTSCLRHAGFAPEGFFDPTGAVNNKYRGYYTVGFAQGPAVAAICGRSGAAACNAFAPAPNCDAANEGETFYLGRAFTSPATSPPARAALQSWVSTDQFAIQALGQVGLNAGFTMPSLVDSAYAAATGGTSPSQANTNLVTDGTSSVVITDKKQVLEGVNVTPPPALRSRIQAADNPAPSSPSQAAPY